MTHLDTPTLAAPRLAPRPLTRRDLPRVLEIGQQLPPEPWMDKDWSVALRSNAVVGWVVGNGREVGGFLLCRLKPRPRPCTSRTRRLLGRVFGLLLPGRKLPHLHADLLSLGVALGWPQAETERALLQEFDRELHRRAHRLCLTVPETCLAAQLFFRDAGFRATRVLHDYYGSEDGYLMVNPPEEPLVPQELLID